MAVAYVNKQESTRTGPNAAAFAPTLPTGWTVGNLLILSCAVFGTGAPTVTTPTGWTLAVSSPTFHSTGNMRLYIWVKVAAASEPAPSLTPSAGVYFHCLIEEYSGTDTTTPLNGTASAGTADTDANVNTPAITTTVANTVIHYTGVTFSTAGTNNTPAGTTSRHNAVFAALGDRLMASDIAQATAATVPATNHTRTTSTTEAAMAATLAIQPPGAPAPTFRSKTDFQGQSTAPSITKPAGVANDDLLLMLIASYHTSSTVDVTTPTGWTLLLSKLTVASDFYHFHVFWKRASSEGASWSLNRGGGNVYWHVTVLAYQGVDTSATPTITNTYTGPISTTSRTAPSITTTVADTVVVPALISLNTTDYDPSAAGTTERSDHYYADVTTNIFAADFVQASAGATGTTTISWSPALGNYWQALTVALPPAGAAAPTFIPQIIIS